MNKVVAALQEGSGARVRAVPARMLEWCVRGEEAMGVGKLGWCKNAKVARGGGHPRVHAREFFRRQCPGWRVFRPCAKA